MARIRPASCYRTQKKAYTRKSKYKKKDFVKGVPGSKIVLFDMGNRKGDFKFKVSLIAKEVRQIRHNALESARMAAQRTLSSKIGVEHYFFKIKTYPHHILRENPIAAGAGADRFQTGMTKSFGKAIGTAARVKPGTEIMYVATTKKNIEKAKRAMKLASDKLGCKTKIRVSL
jgi:large subunit ribosomal protein L10e